MLSACQGSCSSRIARLSPAHPEWRFWRWASARTTHPSSPFIPADYATPGRMQGLPLQRARGNRFPAMLDKCLRIRTALSALPRARCTPDTGPMPTPARARYRSTRPLRMCSRTPSTPPPFQFAALRQHLHAHHESHHRRVRRAHGRARSVEWARWRWRAGRPRSSSLSPACCERATRSWPPRRSTAAPTRSSTSAFAGWEFKPLSSIPTTRRISGAPSRRARGCSMRETIGNPRINVLDIAAVAQIAHEPTFRWSSTTRSPRLICAGRSSTAPISWCIRPRNLSAATAPRSAE